MGSLDKRFTQALILIFVICLVTLSPVTVKATSPRTIIVPDDYPTIQAAIDNANTGDTVFVRSGTYNQTISINKSINLIGEGADSTFLTIPTIYAYAIDVPPPTTYVIEANANNVEISNFTIYQDNVGGVGILTNGTGNQINDLNFGSIETGIVVSGSNQYISKNFIPNAETGIQCNGQYNQIIDNILRGDTTCVFLSGSYNSVTENSVSAYEGIGIIVSNANTNIIYNNEVSGGIHLTNADYNIIYNNSLDSMGFGDLSPMKAASNNFIAGNTIEGAVDWGILVGYGSNNVFYGNLIANNGGYGHDGYGLALGGIDIEVDNNLFYYNMFMNNSGGNFGTNWQVIGSNSFDNGSVGNYWDDYLTKYPNATEIDNSGIGNTPYLVYNNVTDNYPLMAPFDISSISIQLPAWVNTLPNPLPTPSFPPQNLLKSSQPNPTPSLTPTSTSSIPELSWLVIVPLLLSVFSVAVALRHRKTANLSK